MPKWLLYATAAMLIFAVAFTMMPLADKGAASLSPSMLAAFGMTAQQEPNGVSPIMVQILSSFGLVPFAVLLLFSKKLLKATNYKWGVFFASCCGITAGLGNLMFFQALAADGPVSLVVPISALPLLPVIAGPLLFKEHISKAQACGIALAFGAIVLLNTSAQAGTDLKNVNWMSDWMMYTLLALGLFGVAMTTQKAATYHISDELSTVIYAVAFLVLSGFLILWDRTLSWTIPPLAGAVALLFGVCMGAATLLFYAAYRYGKAAVVSPFVLLYPLITVLVAVPVFGEKIDLVRGVGVFLAVAACVLLSIEKAATPVASEQPAETAAVP